MVRADWYGDPSGRYDHRYWDGGAWTGQVARAGQTTVDEPDNSWAPPPPGARAAVLGATDSPSGRRTTSRTLRGRVVVGFVIVAAIVGAFLVEGRSHERTVTKARATHVASVADTTSTATSEPPTPTTSPVKPLQMTDPYGYRWSLLQTGPPRSDVQDSPPGSMDILIPVTITNLQTDRPASAEWIDQPFWVITMSPTTFKLASAAPFAECPTPTHLCGLTWVQAEPTEEWRILDDDYKVAAGQSLSILIDTGNVPDTIPLRGLRLVATDSSAVDPASAKPFGTVPIAYASR